MEENQGQFSKWQETEEKTKGHDDTKASPLRCWKLRFFEKATEGIIEESVQGTSYFQKVGKCQLSATAVNERDQTKAEAEGLEGKCSNEEKAKEKVTQV